MGSTGTVILICFTELDRILRLLFCRLSRNETQTIDWSVYMYIRLIHSCYSHIHLASVQLQDINILKSDWHTMHSWSSLPKKYNFHLYAAVQYAENNQIYLLLYESMVRKILLVKNRNCPHSISIHDVPLLFFLCVL